MPSPSSYQEPHIRVEQDVHRVLALYAALFNVSQKFLAEYAIIRSLQQLTNELGISGDMPGADRFITSKLKLLSDILARRAPFDVRDGNAKRRQ